VAAVSEPRRRRINIIAGNMRNALERYSSASLLVDVTRRPSHLSVLSQQPHQQRSLIDQTALTRGRTDLHLATDSSINKKQCLILVCTFGVAIWRFRMHITS